MTAAEGPNNVAASNCAWDIAAGIPVVLDDGTSRYVYGPSGLIAPRLRGDRCRSIPGFSPSQAKPTPRTTNTPRALSEEMCASRLSWLNGLPPRRVQVSLGSDVSGAMSLTWFRQRSR